LSLGTFSGFYKPCHRFTSAATLSSFLSLQREIHRGIAAFTVFGNNAKNVSFNKTEKSYFVEKVFITTNSTRYKNMRLFGRFPTTALCRATALESRQFCDMYLI